MEPHRTVRGLPIRASGDSSMGQLVWSWRGHQPANSPDGPEKRERQPCSHPFISTSHQESEMPQSTIAPSTLRASVKGDSSRSILSCWRPPTDPRIGRMDQKKKAPSFPGARFIPSRLLRLRTTCPQRPLHLRPLFRHLDRDLHLVRQGHRDHQVRRVHHHRMVAPWRKLRLRQRRSTSETW